MKTNSELVKELGKSNSTNPAIDVGLTTTAVTGAIYTILIYVFPQIPDEVVSASFTILAILLPIITSVIIRHKVWSPFSVQQVVDESVKNALETAKQLNEGPFKVIADSEGSTGDVDS